MPVALLSQVGVKSNPPVTNHKLFTAQSLNINNKSTLRSLFSNRLETILSLQCRIGKL